MAIAFDAATVGGDGTTTFSHTVGSGENRLLAVGVECTGSTNATYCTAITYNDVSMTRARRDIYNTGIGYYLETSIWLLHAPTSSAHNVVITQSGATFVRSIAASYTGCNQSSTADAVNGTTGTGAGTKTVSVTTVADNCWVAVIGCLLDVGAPVLTATQTTRGSGGCNNASGKINFEDLNGPKTPAGAQSMGFTTGGIYIYGYAFSACSFAPADAAASTPIPVFMNQYRQRWAK
jgi:hypothetical protein